MSHAHGSPFFAFKTSTSVLVPEWTTDSLFGLASIMVASAVMSIVFECLQEYTNYLYLRALNNPQRTGVCGAATFTLCEKIIQSFLFTARVVAGYFMMLSVMTYNIWILACVVLGAGIGYGLGKPIVGFCMVKSKEKTQRDSESRTLLEGSATLQSYIRTSEGAYKSCTRNSTGYGRFQPISKYLTASRIVTDRTVEESTTSKLLDKELYVDMKITTL